MVRYLTPPKKAAPPPKRVAAGYLNELWLRRNEMRRSEGLDPEPLVPLSRWHWDGDQDQNMFEAACDALMGSDLDPENGFVPEAAPGFAALLTRIAEQTAAEFGPQAAANAFRWMAAAMDKGG